MSAVPANLRGVTAHSLGLPVDVSPALRSLLAEHGISDLVAAFNHYDPTQAHTCAVCGDAIVPGLLERPAAVATLEGGTVVLALAHASCRDQGGDFYDLNTTTEGDARALPASRAARPHAVLVVEPYTAGAMMGAPGNPGPVDAFTAVRVDLGFTLLTATPDLEHLNAPRADGWSLDTTGGVLELAHREAGLVDYRQTLDTDIAGWVDLARAAGECLVVIGSNLNLAMLEPGEAPRFAAAVRERRLSAATVPVT